MLGHRGDGLADLGWLEVQAKALEVGLDLADDFAFLGQGLECRADLGVPSPVIEAQGLVGQGADEEEDGDKDNDHDQKAGDDGGQ